MSQKSEYEDRVTELKTGLSKVINEDRELGTAYPWEFENDILYEGPLSPLLEFFQEWRSEIEELG